MMKPHKRPGLPAKRIRVKRAIERLIANMASFTSPERKGNWKKIVIKQGHAQLMAIQDKWADDAEIVSLCQTVMEHERLAKAIRSM